MSRAKLCELLKKDVDNFVNILESSNQELKDQKGTFYALVIKALNMGYQLGQSEGIEQALKRISLHLKS